MAGPPIHSYAFMSFNYVWKYVRNKRREFTVKQIAEELQMPSARIRRYLLRLAEMDLLDSRHSIEGICTRWVFKVKRESL